MIEINLNQYAHVMLTPFGRDIWAKGPHTDHVTQEGLLRTQMWCLMQVFGPRLFNGCDMPFTGAGVRVEPL